MRDAQMLPLVERGAAAEDDVFLRGGCGRKSKEGRKQDEDTHARKMKAGECRRKRRVADRAGSRRGQRRRERRGPADAGGLKCALGIAPIRGTVGVSVREEGMPGDGRQDETTAGGQDPAYVKEAFARIAHRYVLTNHVLSCGIDVLWRRRVGRMVAERAPRRVLDVATGTGDLAIEVQRRCPGAEVTGTDFCEEMLERARRRGLRETRVADALELPFETGWFDVVTVAFGLRNMAGWEAGLREMARVTRAGGRIIVLDFSLPRGWMRRPYVLYLKRVLPRLAGALTGERGAYEYLAETIERFPCGEEMLALFARAGMHDAQWIPLSGGIASVYLGSRASRTVDPATQLR